MPLPDFFVIGAPKCGTTALFASLRRHPEIFVPKIKEPHFFSHDPASPVTRDYGKSGVTEPLEYFAMFSGARTERAIGEGSTSYLNSRRAARRIREHVPHAKLVAILRDPVERAHSSYWFYVTLGRERAASFEQAVGGAATGSTMGNHHFRHGLYHAQLSVWFALFPREQIRVYLYEDWRERPHEMLRDLFGFLGVDPDVTVPIFERNVTTAPLRPSLHRSALDTNLGWLAQLSRRHNAIAPPPMSPQTARILRARYRDDIERLQGLIGRDLSGWLRDSERSGFLEATSRATA